jgi:hypothetical protein
MCKQGTCHASNNAEEGIPTVASLFPVVALLSSLAAQGSDLGLNAKLLK